jgi:hypothetical protein
MSLQAGFHLLIRRAAQGSFKHIFYPHIVHVIEQDTAVALVKGFFGFGLLFNNKGC